MDKMELALDLVKEATINAGFLLNTDLAIFVDVGATMLYDEVLNCTFCVCGC